jgi:dimethylhistidine N-methyltransferase
LAGRGFCYDSNQMGSPDLQKNQSDLIRFRANFLVTELGDVSPAAFGEVIKGLKSKPKRIPCKYFYDSEGSRLFDLICELPEYYLTRIETSILDRHIGSILARLGGDLCVIEPGAGSCLKARLFFESGNVSSFIPLDVSTEHLRKAAMKAAEDFPGLFVHALAMDFTAEMGRIEPFLPDSSRRVIFYPGSSIGNFDPPDAGRLLTGFSGLLRTGDMLLIGYDLIKDPDILKLAYDDPGGITAAFNLNLLARLNRELGANFDQDEFRHIAFYNDELSRIEMHLESRIAQDARISDEIICFDTCERIHTENSYKYSISGFDHMTAGAGFEPAGTWTDPSQYFAVSLYEKSRKAMKKFRRIHV